METIGAITIIVVLFIGFAFLMKHQQTFSWWIQTPRYDNAYKRKMLQRRIEDAQDELNYMDTKDLSKKS